MSKNDLIEVENMDQNFDKGFTVKEVANVINETPNVVRNWFKELRNYIPHEKDINGYNLFKKEGIERFQEIKTLHRDQKYSMKQIEHFFFSGGETFKVEPPKDSGELIAERLEAMQQELTALKEQLNKQEQFNKALVDQLQRIDKKIDRSSLERHNQLTQDLKDTLETQKLVAAASEEEKKEKKKGFFSWWKK